MTLYRLSRCFLNTIFSTVWRMRVVGREEVPQRGPLIVVANHVSYFDPPVIGCALPRPLHFMAKKELFEIPLFGSLIRSYNAFPVDRGRGDITAIRRAVQALKEGSALLIFPEGSRNRGGKARGQEGAALLASLSGAPILPAYLHGTFDVRRFRQIKVVFGKPFHPGDGGKATREELAKRTNEIMERIFALRERI